MKKLLTVLLVCLMAMSLLAGCGGNDDANTPPANTDGADTPADGEGDGCLLYTSGTQWRRGPPPPGR